MAELMIGVGVGSFILGDIPLGIICTAIGIGLLLIQAKGRAGDNPDE